MQKTLSKFQEQAVQLRTNQLMNTTECSPAVQLNDVRVVESCGRRELVDVASIG